MNSKSNTQPSAYYVEGVLNGNISILSRAITIIESSKESHKILAKEILEGILNYTGNSFRLGITGVPGVGKSTFIESFGKIVVEKGHKLAVLAVDPSSTISKGSILGDKTRMEELSSMKNVFIRPSPSGGALGGVAKATYETILLCEAAGYDFVIVETVGVGQSEVAVKKITDFFLLLMLAGAGDELQGIKRGIMEMADAIAITKADGSNLERAKVARTEFSQAIHYMQLPESGFVPKVGICSSFENTGIKEIYELLNEYKAYTSVNEYFLKKRRDQQFELLLSAIDESLKNAFYSNELVRKKLSEIKGHQSVKDILPFVVGIDLVKKFLKEQ